ncbi:unnamed protein product [Rotaria sp. Silwood2]|nr:unnamed protein product [Rotaria sp. Silwood2]CAF3294351.1 unnamed protein product [Rotaria sp. Silwood2]CAF3458990.1 unnamed protein product [Rotaria sp. Silwood2]CAF3480542.1 unnamed protein product [Rotaria sp. Silwood2]CAF4184921.1 unnamed protein product [Rotaria sp. Silwood2]
MASNWYVRHFNSYTTRGRANSVMAVLGDWIFFGYTMTKLSQSRKAKRLASEPPQPSGPVAHSTASSSKKNGHH